MSKVKMISPEVKNVPWQEKPEGLKGAPIWRYSENPIIGRNPIEGVARIFNSAVMPFEDGFIGVFRGEQTNGIPYIYLGRSKDAIHWEFDSNKIPFVDEDGNPFMPIYAYDPRLVKVEDTYYIIWCQDFYGASIGMAKTTDFKTFVRLENPFIPFNRNAVLFPRKINGNFIMLSRPSDSGHTPFGDIFLSESPDMVYWGKHRHVMGRSSEWWESVKIGGGAAPIETSEGWLLFYHGVSGTCNGYVYSICGAILDIDNPSIVKYRCENFLLTPEEWYEERGFVPNVTFPCATIHDSVSGKIAVYYGCVDIWLNNVARLACMGGATADDVAQISFGYGTFTGALGLHGGLEKIGAAVIPMSSGNTNKQIMFLQDMGVTLLVATPSYALHLGEELRHRGIDPSKDLKIHIGLFGGEGMTEPMRDEMHKVWGDQFVCTQNYGMSELCGPGVAGECTELCGMHINEDWFIPEVIDPETEEVLPPGELGELVVTCLGKEALPLVRYRTGDLTRLMYEPCKCGRTTVRMENLSGRADDMLVIRGVNVFPGQIEEVLFKIDEIGPHYEILVERKNRLDVMTITVELIDDRLLDSYGQLSELENRIKTRLKSQLGLATQIRLVAPNSLQRFEGKAKRVTDLRKDGL